MTKFLQNINYPSDLKKLKPEELVTLCDEIREFLIDECSKNPGHFASSLCAVELAVALHYVYNTPYDKIIWDVGHQAYAHKILTGRKDAFGTNRKYGGLCGFPKIDESEYDAFGGGHASVSISAALGMAVAFRLNNEKREIVAIIGDGSMTGGLAFEGLNNAGCLKTDMLVILNDNNMAIDNNVGAMGKYLLKISASQSYNKIKNKVWGFLGKGFLRRCIQKIARGAKLLFFREHNMFESLGFRYFGTFDGHNLPELIKTLKKIKRIKGPKLLHVITKKGKGYEPAEKNQTEWHAPGMFNKETGERIITQTGKPNPLKYQDIFGKTIIELAKMNDKIVGITPAMPTGCSLNMMMAEMPDRSFDVGIAEGHAVTFSAGLAVGGKLPFCNIYSSFMQRAYDNVIHDVALQKLNVVFCLDRAGIVGEDGATHHGVYDLAYFRCIPNMIVSAPMDGVELRNMMYTAQLPNKGPFSIRYPRGSGVITNCDYPFVEIEIGKARKISDGTDLAILSIGNIGNNVLTVVDKLKKENISIAHYDMRFVKPIDKDVLHELGKKFDKVITIEDATVVGGLGGAVSEFFMENNYSPKLKIMGIPDRFILHGTIQQLHAECGIDKAGIEKSIRDFIKK